MSKYEKYLNTIDSGLEWLGQIPAHWNVQYSKWLFSERNTKALPSDEMLTASQKYGVIPQKLFMELEQQKVVQVLKGHDILKRVEQDDFVISMRSFQGGIEYCPYTGAVSSAYVPLEPQGNISRTYYKYLFKSKPYIQALQTTTNLVRDGQALRYNNFIQVRLPVPQIDEANNIGLFLDHETAKIDTLIEKQQKLIELLKEKRQAVISHAVTKGLNPDAPMKDSGVEWLGEVPEHWGISSLGYYATLNTGATPDRSNMSYWNGDIPWIKTGEVKYNKIFETEELITDLAVKQTSVQLSPPGTLLMAMYGQGITRGRVAILGTPATYNQACAAINPNKLLWNEYLQLFFIAGYHAIRDGGNETSQMNLNADIVRKFKVSIPPIKEQKDIVAYLERKLPSFDNLLCKAEQAINLMQERRTALISAAVTGKIDVRNWVEPTTSSDTNEAQQKVTA